MVIEATIEDGKVRAITVEGEKVRLNDPVDLAEFEELEEHFEYVRSKFILSDFANIEDDQQAEEDRAQWDKNTLFQFLDKVKKRGKRKGKLRQTLFLKKLAESPEGATPSEIINWMEEHGESAEERSLGGIQGSMTKRAENQYKTDDGRKRERIWDARRNEGGDKIYKLRPQYADWVKEYFDGG